MRATLVVVKHIRAVIAEQQTKCAFGVLPSQCEQSPILLIEPLIPLDNRTQCVVDFARFASVDRTDELEFFRGEVL